MTLEDLFTLTEMKDGLAVPSRVEELVAVMSKENSCTVKNVGDAMRQRSTVAKVIAATENKGCLDLFIRLDGLLIIDGWLKDAQKFSEDSSDSLVEELILALLHALDKLGIGNQKQISSGIYLTVRDLLGHTSLNIQDKAKAFLGNQKTTSMSGDVKLDSVEGQAVSDDTSQPGNKLIVESLTPIYSSAISLDQKADVDQHLYQLARNIAAPSGSCVNKQSEGVEAVVKEPDKLAIHFSECDLKEEDDKADYSVRPEAFSSEQKSTSDTPDTEQGGMRSKHLGPGSVLEVTNSETHIKNSPDEFGKVKANPASVMPKRLRESLDPTENYVVETDRNGGRVTDNQVDRSTINSILADLPTSGSSTRGYDRGALMNCTVTLAQKTTRRSDVNSANTSQDSPVDGITLRKSQDPDKSVERIKHDPRQLRSSRVFESSRSFNRVDVASKTSSMDLEYGMVDALEVACLVAKEVERQVTEDCDEQYGSFSTKSSRGDTLHPVGSTDSLNEKNDQHADGSTSSESLVEKMSVDHSSGEDESSKTLDNVDAEQENDTGVVESSQVTETAPEAANSADKNASEFDLNLEICSEAAEDAGNSLPNPVAIVSASKAVVVPGFPSPPLKFEGALGWKGSASTSAFRPASPRRSDGYKTMLNEEATNGSRQGKGFVFDLNFSEDSSGESMAEQSPKRCKKLGFDLNLMSEDRDAPFTPSVKSSARNFDLNDNPLNFSETSDLLPCLGASSSSSSHQVNSYGGSSNDSVISIMGAKVKQSTFLHQPPFSFFNGSRASDPMLDPNTGRSGPPLVPSHIYGYNGMVVGPTMSFSPPMYGPSGSAAYMVDPRVMMGAPPPAFHASFAHPPSYATNMVGPGSNGVSSFRPHLDFNPGFIIDGPTNRVDAGGFRQLFPGQGRSADVQLQPLFPGIGGKRKEPEGGGEFYQPPPHL